MTERTRLARFVGVLLLTLVFAGCLSDDTDGGSGGGPQVSFTNPAEAALIQTPDIVVNIIGTAKSDAEIEAVEWTNDRGGRGSANGKENWVTGNIVLKLGLNNITVTATDTNGESNSKSITVERENPKSLPLSNSDTPEVLYSYQSSLADAAPVSGASIDATQTHIFFVPSAEWDQRGIAYVEYRCCRGLSGPGETDDYGPAMTVSNRPWSMVVDFSGFQAGGTRRLRTLVHFSDGSAREAVNFDFTVSSGGTSNRTPSISGRPPGSATVGVAYNFQPTATDADGDSLSFSIVGKPAWASFDRSSGRLSGKPTSLDVGLHNNILISVSDGKSTAKLPAFAVTVSPVASGTATLTWNAPTERTDNSVLADLAGFEIHYGQSGRSYTNRVVVGNPGINTYVVDNLPSGTWYFAVTAFDATGQSSDFSNEGQLTIP